MRHRHILLMLLAAIIMSGCTFGQNPAEPALTGARPAAPATRIPLPSPLPSATPAPTASDLARTPTPTPPIGTIVPTPTLAPLSREQRLQIFQQVWEKVRDNYVYPDYNGLDWQAIREELRPKVAAAVTPEEFYSIMREMIARLGDDHSRFESPQEVAAQLAEASGQLQYGGIGVSVRTIDEGGLITRVVPGGPADQAGILTRDIIVAVNGIPFNDPNAFGPDGAIGAVRGIPGTSVRLTIKRGNEPLREIEVVRAVIDIAVFNRVTVERLAGDVGLLTIPSFYVDNADSQARDALTNLLAAGPVRGMIIDVRDNSGGYIHIMRNIIALFHDGGSIGTSVGRNEREEQRIPRGKTIAGLIDIPIVVLISEETASAAEMFAAGMRVLCQATIVGVPSAGNTENLYGYNFDDGSRLLLAEVAYQLPDGTLIEGTGVVPDVLIEAEWWRFPREQDPQLQAALAIIQKPS
ncbi:S41 family peptidase [Chloroflexus aggregans]|uniref:Peptidase S41 n=1 Tax=Chloroflexus aggregans (strain MD-66 / DSM 9485) TaxID=326427 RepID=B8GBK8_CHLAD|nr:S41 family peptidase [Chloroflexus aggregans]ACL22955.1 peptidase S41 [Chloroflexus aggregans DSM 9485]